VDAPGWQEFSFDIGYKGYRFPPEIIQQAIWLYVRFTLSFRDVDCWRNAASWCPTRPCRWVNHFGLKIAADLRKRRPKPRTTEIDWGEDQVWAWEMLRAGFHKAYIDDGCIFHSHRYAPEECYNVSVTEGSLFARHFGWNLHPNPQALEAEIEAMNVRDTQYAVANKIPYQQLKQQKQLNKATIEGRAHGAAGQERTSGTRTSPDLFAPPKIYAPPKKSRASQR
jgi:hypothetical protein